MSVRLNRMSSQDLGRADRTSKVTTCAQLFFPFYLSNISYYIILYFKIQNYQKNYLVISSLLLSWSSFEFDSQSNFEFDFLDLNRNGERNIQWYPLSFARSLLFNHSTNRFFGPFKSHSSPFILCVSATYIFKKCRYI